MEKLIIISHAYPYNPPTEQFLHTEMEYVLSRIDEIIIVPTSQKIDVSKKRTLDNRARVMHLRRSNKIIEIVVGLTTNTFFNKSFWLELTKVLFYFNSKISKLRSIIELTNSFVRSGYCTIQLKKLILSCTSNKQDNIILYSYWFNNNVIVASKLKKYLVNKGWKNVKVVTRAHGQGDLYIEYRPQMKLINEQVDKVFTISSNGADFLADHGIKRCIIETNRLGVRKQNLHLVDKHMSSIVSCSTLNHNKRVERIIESLSLIKNQNIKWTHFGDGALYNDLVELCERILPSNIIWEIKGNVSNEEILHYYLEEQPSCFINVSNIEGIPVSIMEAFSCKIPVIATDVGATSEIVNNGLNGYLIDKEFDNSELKSLIIKLCKDAELNSRLSIEAYNTWNKKFNSDVNFNLFIDICKNLF